MFRVFGESHDEERFRNFQGDFNKLYYNVEINISLILQLIQAKTEITFFMVGDCFLKYKANHWTPVIFNGLAKVVLTLQNTYSFN